MDTRKERTRRAIKEAFLKMYPRRRLEKITIKEICTGAGINKSTFYCHYCDVYDLCDQIQEETVSYILGTIADSSALFHSGHDFFTRALFQALADHAQLLGSIFSDREQGQLMQKLENGIKELVYQTYPHYREDPQMQLLLTYSIYGGYYAWQRNQWQTLNDSQRMIEKIAAALQPLYK